MSTPSGPSDRTITAPASPLHVAPERTANRIGRYVLLEQLGAGGIGVVIKAYDPDLDRAIALKLLQRSQLDDEARARFQREAQAIARLRHPNVVTVYDVGDHEGEPYLAMELVRGGSVRDWLRAEPRTTEEILKVFREAAAGLIAAHEHGIVHRDFKPSNVLIDDDGSVRVADFGLARSIGGSDESWSNGADSVALDAAITRTGAILGTPAYMAPEQLSGAVIDARADQYAFCVSLHEALYGERPFPESDGTGTDSGQRKRQLPDDHGVPTWVDRIIERGLHSDPSQRYPAMPDLLEDLRRDPRSKRRRAAGIGIVSALLIAGFALVYNGSGRGAFCKSARDRLAGIWDDDVKVRVRAAFESTGVQHASDTYRRVETVLDRYAGEWVGMRTDACEATHVHGEQSSQLLDLRMECLDRRAGEIGALTSLFAAEASEQLLSDAVDAAYGLADLSQCADREGLLSRVPMPSDAGLRARIRDAEARLNEIRARFAAGRHEEGRELATKLEAEVSDIEYPPIHAELMYMLGRYSANATEAETWLAEAAHAAGEARDDRLLARVWMRFAFLVGQEQGRFAEADAYARAANAALARLDDSESLEAEFAKDNCFLLQFKGEYEHALRECERAIKLNEAIHREPHVSTATAFINLAIVLKETANADGSAEACEEALRILSLTVGEDHPEVARALGVLADSLEERLSNGKTRAEGRYDPEKALALKRRALELRERLQGPEHPDVAAALVSLGVSLKNRGELEEAAALYERAIAIWEASDSPAWLGIAYTNFGVLRRKQGRPQDAVRLLERGLAYKTETLGEDNPSVGITLLVLARAYVDTGDYTKALSAYERALPLRRKKLGEAHPKIGDMLHEMGMVMAQLDDGEKMLRYCGEALRIHDGVDVYDANTDRLCIASAQLALNRPADVIAQAEEIARTVETNLVPADQRSAWLFVSAQLLWEVGVRPRALTRAREAREEAHRLGPGHEEELAIIDSWIRRPRRMQGEPR